MMDKAFFEQKIDRRNTSCEKWDDRSVMREGGIPLWVADMDFACPPQVTDALKKRAAHPCYGYTAEDEYAANTEALRAFWARRHALELAAEECVMLPCVITGLKLAVRLLTDEGEGVAVMTPVYGPFYQAVKLNGRTVVEIPLKENEDARYEMDFDALEEALKDGVSLIMLCSPHNPVSRLWTRSELERVAALAKQYDAKIVCDEIHADFVYAPGTFVPLLSVPDARERSVMLCSASKTFNIAGLQQACAVIPNAEIREQFRAKMDAAGIVCGNTMALTATRTAYNEGDEWLDALIAYLDENRAYLTEYVRTELPKAKLTPIEATYLGWLDCRAWGKTTDELMKLCVEEGVAFTGGTFFGTAGDGFLRVNFACPREQLTEGLERLKKALEKA